uniref:SUEL-type lectin domain-containing protein n=1 Tax=Biomphalaria glabrata TaxID=6526 RepID=A0A2C9JK74_BIOGL
MVPTVSTADHKWGRMLLGHDIVILVALTFTLASCEPQQTLPTKSVSACYGNLNQYLRLDCPEGKIINVTKIRHAAKNKTANCPSPASMDTYRKECCVPEAEDCNSIVQDSTKAKCDNKQNCIADATWSNIITQCDQLIFPSQSNYMVVEYVCKVPELLPPKYTNGPTVNEGSLLTPTANTTISGGNQLIDTSANQTTSSLSDYTRSATTALSSAAVTTSSTSSTKTTTPTTTKASTPATTTTLATTTTAKSTAASSASGEVKQTTTFTEASNATSTSNANGTSTAKRSTQKHTAESAESSESKNELSDAMVGAIVGGSLGMMLTLVVFIFYWGRKRHLRIVGKHQPTVWDYLLSQTFTVRGTRGYDHFSSIRSSASSDSETNSPMARKNLWLPNIVHRDASPLDDTISNYDNDANGSHRVEIHPQSDPAPFAFLNLYVGAPNSNHHEA